MASLKRRKKTYYIQ